MGGLYSMRVNQTQTREMVFMMKPNNVIPARKKHKSIINNKNISKILHLIILKCSLLVGNTDGGCVVRF